MPISARTFAQAARFTPYQTLLAGLLAFLQFAVITDCLIIAPLGAVVMPALAISPGEFGMIVSAHTFSAGLGGLLVAGVADRFDHRRLLLLFCAGFVGGATWSGLAADFATLLMARIVAGFSGGAVAAAISAVVADLCQPRLHSRLTGIIQSAFAAVQIVGLPVGLYLSVAGTWHAPFLVLAAMGMACGCLILLWMQPVTAERAAEAERYSLIDVLRTVSVPRFAPGFAVMGLMTMGTYLVFPFSSAFAVSNLGVPFETLPAIYLIAGLGTIACGIFVGRTTHSAGMWPAFVTSNALAVSVVLIYANLVDASLAMVAALNFLMFAGLFARVVALRSLLGYIPRLPHRRSFNIASIAVHFFAGGLAACARARSSPSALKVNSSNLKCSAMCSLRSRQSRPSWHGRFATPYQDEVSDSDPMKYRKDEGITMNEKGSNTFALPLVDNGQAPATTTESLPHKSGRRWRNVLLLSMVLSVGVVAGAVLQPPAPTAAFDLAKVDPIQSSSVAPSDQEEKRPRSIATLEVVALGRLLPDGGTLAVAVPNGAGDARIARLLVAEGDRVAAGQIIAELDNLPQLLATKASAESTLAAQEAALGQVRASIEASLAEARADRISADASLVLARQDLARLTKLAERNLTTQVLLQQAQSTAARAAAELERAEALVKRFSGAATGRQPDIMLAARNVDLAQANLRRASEDLAATQVLAPRTGTVLEIIAHVGERPSDAGVVKIGDIEKMTAELEVYQTDIDKVTLGQTVEMTARALKAPLSGTVTKISLIVGRQSVMSSEPAANADARVIRVTIALDTISSARARSYTNLEVVGRIRTTAP